MIPNKSASPSALRPWAKRLAIFFGVLLSMAGLMVALQGFDTNASNERNTDMNTQSTPPELTIWMGMQGIDMVRAHGGKEDKQPAGALFHTMRWPKSPFGTLTLRNDQHSFSLPTVLYIQTFTDNLFAADGVARFRITAGVSHEEFVSHAEAHRAVFAFIDSLLAKGWVPYVDPAGAMLRGPEALRYYMEERGWLNDAQVRPSFEQWMKVNSSTPLHTYLYANGVVLAISIRRDDDKMDLTKPGQYVLSLTITSAVGEMRTYVGAGNFSREKAPTWTQYWPAKLKELEAIKVQETAKLQAKGYKVDTRYQHPDWSMYLK
jgi:hypothetical protein